MALYIYIWDIITIALSYFRFYLLTALSLIYSLVGLPRIRTCQR